MLKSMKVINIKKDKKEFILNRGVESGFLIQKISGLGPTDADISISNVVTFDGGIYNSSRAKIRNIVIEFILLGPDVESRRLELYKYFPLKEEVELEFKTDSRYAGTYGYVEKIEPEIFSDKEVVQISILCPDSYMKDLQNGGKKVYSFYSIAQNFEFPFFNESLTEKKIEFGIIRGDFVQDIIYTGEVETGFIMSIVPLHELTSNIIISNVDTGEDMLIYTKILKDLIGSPFTSSDELIISTIKGYKYVILIRNGKEYNVLNCLDRASDWLQLRQGINKFAYSIANDPNIQIKFDIKTTNLLLGV